MDVKGKSKGTFFLCEELIKTKTPDFKRGKLHERVKLFSMKFKIGDFNKDFYIKQILVLWLASTATLVPWAAPVAQVHPRTAGSMLYADLGLGVNDHEHGIGMGRVDMERGPDSG